MCIDVGNDAVHTDLRLVLCHNLGLIQWRNVGAPDRRLPPSGRPLRGPPSDPDPQGFGVNYFGLRIASFDLLPSEGRCLT